MAPHPGLGPAPRNTWEPFHHSPRVLDLTPKEWQALAPGLPFSLLALAVPPDRCWRGAGGMGRDVSVGHGDRV